MLNNFISIYKKQNNFDRLIYLIVFIFPVFAISIRSWVSVIFVILALLSIGYYITSKRKDYFFAKEEKYYTYILVFYFIVFLASSFVNDWGDPQTHALGTMVRFLVMIPIFYMFRHLKYLLPALAAGCVIACIFNIVYLFENPSKGVYSHLFSGPMTFLFSLFILYAIKSYRLSFILKIGLSIVFLLSILTIFELGSRSAFVALILTVIFYSIIYTQGLYRLLSVSLIVIISTGAYFGNDNVKIRIDRITNGVSVYLNEKNPELANAKFMPIHDISARFEMWRAGKYFIAKNPIFGFGPNEFQTEIKKLIDKKLISSVAQASHPHNAYLHELFAKGIFGLIAMLLVLYYPLFIFIKYYKFNPEISILGILIIIAFSSYSLTESAAFNNNNFSSIMLIFISIVFISVFQKLKQTSELVYE